MRRLACTAGTIAFLCLLLPGIAPAAPGTRARQSKETIRIDGAVEKSAARWGPNSGPGRREQSVTDAKWSARQAIRTDRQMDRGQITRVFGEIELDNGSRVFREVHLLLPPDGTEEERIPLDRNVYFQQLFLAPSLHFRRRRHTDQSGPRRAHDLLSRPVGHTRECLARPPRGPQMAIRLTSGQASAGSRAERED